MSYDSTILVDVPVGYWKCNEVFGETTFTDYSSNSYHASLASPSSIPIEYGLLSPIETDPQPDHALAGGVGRAPAQSALNTTGACSWEVWGYSGEEGAGTSVLITRANSAAGIGGTNIRINGQTITVRLRMDSTGTTNWEVSFGNQIPWETWFHIVMTRSGNVLRLYVNGVLEDERTDLPTDTITFAEPNWGLSATPTGTNIGESWGVSRIAIYNTQLSAARVLAHYEAAKLSLPVSATINVRSVVTLETDQIIPVDFPFAHNWADAASGQERPIIERLSWNTNVNQSEPDYQQRINARPHGPRREMEYAITPNSPLARARFHRLLWAPGQIYKMPIWTDWTPLTAQANASDGDLDCNTIKKDFEVDSHAVAFSDVYDPATAQFFQLSAVADAQLTITPNVGLVLPVNNPCAPARLANIIGAVPVDSHTSDRETARIRFQVIDTELSSRRITTYTPASTYRTVEVFNLDKARVEMLEPTPYEIRRRYAMTGNLTGNDFARAVDTGSPQTVPVRVLLDGLNARSEFYGWLSARQGKQNPVWIPTQEQDFEVRSVPGSGTLIVTAGYFATYNLHYGRRDIQIAYTDGTVTNHRITGVSNSGATDMLTVDGAISLVKTVQRVSFLRFCVAPDEFELIFHRNLQDFVVECSFQFQELLTTPD